MKLTVKIQSNTVSNNDFFKRDQRLPGPQSPQYNTTDDAAKNIINFRRYSLIHDSKLLIFNQ